MNVKRRTFSLDPDLDDALTYLHRRLGISKSAVVNELLTDPVRDLCVLMQEVPEQPTPDDIVRLRGRSVELVKERLSVAGLGVEDDRRLVDYISNSDQGA